MIRNCPTCGLDTFSIDDLYCPSGCGTFLAAPPRPESLAERRRRLRASMSDHDRDVEEALEWRRSVATLHLKEAAKTGPASIGAKSKRRKDTDARARKVQKLKAQGMTQAKIARETGWHPTTVARLLQRDLPS